MVASVYKWLKISALLFLPAVFSGFAVKPLPGAALHPLYVSVIEVEYNATDKTVEISCKLFSDDFEKALIKAGGGQVDILNPKDKPLLEKQIADYIRRHMQIKADGKPLPLEYVGYEIEAQSALSYYQVSNVNSSPKKIDININILHELYDKQINILHVSVGGNRKSTKLDYPVNTASFEF